jgi:hypothetical protein
MGPNIIQQEKQMEAISDEALQQLLRQMAQTNQVGTPGFILAAGELQGRKEARQQAMMGQGNPRPVIADLLMGDAMPPQMPMLPENAGGIAALPAPNMEGIATLAGGGLVAFSNGGDVKRRFEALPRYVGQEAGVPGAELTNYFKSRMRGDARIDPVTGQPVTFGEFVRLEDQRAAAAARTPAIAAIPAGTVTQQPSDQSFLSGLLTAASPGIAAPPPPPAPSATGMPTMNVDNLKAVRAADNTGLAAIGQSTSGAGTAPAPKNEPTVKVPPAPLASAASAASAAPDYSAHYNNAKTFVQGIFGPEPTLPAEPNVANIKKDVEDTRQMFKDLGIADPTELRKKQIEDAMKEAKTEKQNAGWTWLANFGAAWAAENGSALQAATKANQKAMPGLMSDLKDLKKLQREQQKELAGLEALKAQSERDLTLKARDRLRDERTKVQDRIDERNKTIATASVSLAANVATNQTQLQAANIGAESRRYEVDTVERRIEAMPGATKAERIANYYKAVNPRAAVATDELDKAAASLAKDPTKLATLKTTDPALYALIKQRINALAVPEATSNPTGKVRD